MAEIHPHKHARVRKSGQNNINVRLSILPECIMATFGNLAEYYDGKMINSLVGDYKNVAVGNHAYGILLEYVKELLYSGGKYLNIIINPAMQN